jgi:hypothetical protein
MSFYEKSPDSAHPPITNTTLRITLVCFNALIQSYIAGGNNKKVISYLSLLLLISVKTSLLLRSKVLGQLGSKFVVAAVAAKSWDLFEVWYRVLVPITW